MGLGVEAEYPEEEGPYTDEEYEDEEDDGPSGSMRARPEVCPIAAIGGG